MGWMQLVAEATVDTLRSEDLSELSHERLLDGLDEAWRAMELLNMERRRLLAMIEGD
jgi:hypothetical protein